MSMIAQNAEKVQMADTISRFLKRFRVGDLLKACNAYKEKGVSVVRLFIYMLQMVFADRSMYMQMRTGRCESAGTVLIDSFCQRKESMRTVPADLIISPPCQSGESRSMTVQYPT